MAFIRPTFRQFSINHFANPTRPSSALRNSSKYFTSTRYFHATPSIMVQVGDSIPSVDVMEGSPGNKVNLAKELGSGKGLIIGVPAAFSKLILEYHNLLVSNVFERPCML
jgi:hypothetical protein